MEAAWGRPLPPRQRTPEEGPRPKPPPGELVLYWICKDLGYTPEQALAADWYLVDRMRLFAQAHNLYTRILTLKGEAIHTLTEGELELKDEIEEMLAE